ncbi:10536_t:CDS:2 [Scutellospora calospora]|uniref:10536_t:CDS:1 n=1 Tax=Scutellospora calospora TaxID=85575 RepID=A0ACA9JTR4_9GLOM|nr:10536_t:CDS:2 [Scutellospora calospora]
MYCASSPLVGRNQHAPEIMKKTLNCESMGNSTHGQTSRRFGCFSLGAYLDDFELWKYQGWLCRFGRFSFSNHNYEEKEATHVYEMTYGAIRETIAYLSYGLSSGIDRKFKMMKIIQVRSIGGIYNGSVKHS